MSFRLRLSLNHPDPILLRTSTSCRQPCDLMICRPAGLNQANSNTLVWLFSCSTVSSWISHIDRSLPASIGPRTELRLPQVPKLGHASKQALETPLVIKNVDSIVRSVIDSVKSFSSTGMILSSTEQYVELEFKISMTRLSWVGSCYSARYSEISESI